MQKHNNFVFWFIITLSLCMLFILLPVDAPIAKGQSCPVATVTGVQPDLATLSLNFTRACTNSLITDKPTPEVTSVPAVAPKVPRIYRGYPASVSKPVDGYIPCVILMAIGQQESTGWKQFNANYGQSGGTVLSGDCGYGIMQITGAPIMTGQDANVNRNRVVSEATYNIGTGARVLIEKWNGLSYYSGNNDPYIAEDWYYAVWSYNGFAYSNNPNNASYPSNRLPFTGSQAVTDYP